MFQKGVTTAEIAHFMELMYGHHYTPQTVLVQRLRPFERSI